MKVVLYSKHTRYLRVDCKSFTEELDTNETLLKRKTSKLFKKLDYYFNNYGSGQFYRAVNNDFTVLKFKRRDI